MRYPFICAILWLLFAGCRIQGRHYSGVDSVRFQLEKVAREQRPDAELAAWQRDVSERIREQLAPKSIELRLKRTTLTEVRVAENDKVMSQSTRPVIWLYVIVDLGDAHPTVASLNERLRKAVKSAGFPDSDLTVVGSRGSFWGVNGWLRRGNTNGLASQPSP